MALLKRHNKEQGAGNGQLEILEEPVEFKERPALSEFLTLFQWEDGSERETGTVNIFFQDGRVKVCLTDKDGQKMAYLTIRQGGSILDQVEEAILADDTGWRAYEPFKKKSSK